MVWSCILESQKGPLVVLEYPGGYGRSMTAKQYREQVLEGVLHEFYQDMSEDREVWLYFRRMAHHPTMQRAPMTLQTSQNFLIQKMFQKNLIICPILPPLFDPKKIE